MVARRLLIKGRVQGVFYRNWSVGVARELELTGWVRNLRSGDVEIFAVGEEEAVQSLIDRCRSGPPAASVTSIDVTDAPNETLTSFEKRPTA